MKKIIIRSSVISLILAATIETICYFRMWRPHFVSVGEFFFHTDVRGFFVPVNIPCLFAGIEIDNGKGNFHTKARLAIGFLSASIAAAMLYFDDRHGFGKFLQAGSIIGMVVYGSLIFLAGSFLFLLVKQKI